MTTHVLIAGGGTGGHLFPGLAVAEELRRRGVEVTFVGTARGIEARVVPGEGYPLRLIDVAGLKGKGPLGAARGLLRLPQAALQALRLLHELRPQGVIGVGGYASGPVVALAALRGLPTVILEQNSVPGVTNRLLSRLSRRVFIAFPEAATFFPAGRTELLGNPIRRAVLDRASPAAPASSAGPRLLVLGGSQGAHAVNELVCAAVAHLHARANRDRTALPRLRHQTGSADAEWVSARYRELGLTGTEAEVVPFIDDMGRAYAEADLVVGRAGATTLAELTACGLPALLIPLPTAADDHQTRNARWLESQGAARVLPQKDTTPEALGDLVAALCRDQAALGQMAQRSRLLGRPDAAAAVAGRVLDLIQSR